MRTIHIASKPRVGVSILIAAQALTILNPSFENISADDAATAKKSAASLQVSTRLSESEDTFVKVGLISNSCDDGSALILVDPFWTVDLEVRKKSEAAEKITNKVTITEPSGNSGTNCRSGFLT